MAPVFFCFITPFTKSFPDPDIRQLSSTVKLTDIGSNTGPLRESSSLRAG